MGIIGGSEQRRGIVWFCFERILLAAGVRRYCRERGQAGGWEATVDGSPWEAGGWARGVKDGVHFKTQNWGGRTLAQDDSRLLGLMSTNGVAASGGEKAAGRAGVCPASHIARCLSFTVRQRFSHLREQQTPRRGLLSQGSWTSGHGFHSLDEGRSRRTCISHQFPGDADAAGPRTSS